MLVNWRPQAREAFLEILGYIEERNLIAAADLQSAIETAVDGLPAFPFTGRRGREDGTRELVVTANYIVVYQVGDKIEVIDVLHARQRYPKTTP